MPNYDVVVVGAGLGGLAAATLASKMNKKVLVLEPADTFGGVLEVCEKNGFRFYSGPTLSYGFEKGGPFHRLNEELGIALHASFRSPCYQVALPDRRITIYAEVSETLQELSREFPDEINKISKFYQDIRKEGVQNSKSRFSAFLSKSRTAGPFLRNYQFSNEFSVFIHVLSLYFFGMPAARLSLSSLVSLFDTSPFIVAGGFRTIAAQLAEILFRNQGEIRYHAPFSEMTIKARSISLSDELFVTRAVLMNTAQQFPRRHVFIGIREEVVPVGMLHNVLYVPDYARPDNFITFSISEKDDDAVAPRGMRTLTVSFLSGQAGSEQLQHIKAVIPFLDQFSSFMEEYRPAERSMVLPGNIKLKSIKSAPDQTLLNRSSLKGVYFLSDVTSTPVQTIIAARRFAEEMS